MVIIKILGGLGNQMFQYAFGRYMAITTGEPLYLDLTELLNWDGINYTPRRFALDIFNIEYAAKIRPGELTPFYKRLMFKYLTRKVCENGFLFDSSVMVQDKKSLYLSGFWQNEKYFKPVENAIRKDFTFSRGFSGHNLAEDKIRAENSVSIHFRLGDYLSNPAAKGFHGVPPIDYYRDAIDQISRRVAAPHFFIFSDDLDWVKRNFLVEEDHTFVTGSDTSAASDMYLMSLCKHNIIANSSFSWWGAWLNQNPDKIVIAPKKWFANTQTDIIPEQWLQI